MGESVEAPESMDEEEFGRLHEEILALKMQNRDLEDDLERMERGNSNSPSRSPDRVRPREIHEAAWAAGAPPPPSAAAFGAKLANVATNIKVGAGAMTALGAKGAASVRQVARRGSTPEALSIDDLTLLAQRAANTFGAATASKNEGEALQTEVNDLRKRLEEALQEATNARAVAMESQQKAAAETSAAEQALLAGVKLPTAEALRARVIQLETDSAAPAADISQAQLVRNMSDALLSEIARSVIHVLRSDAAAVPEPPSPPPPPPPKPKAPEGDSIKQLMKIQQQQKDLEKLRDFVEKQRSEKTKLSIQVAEIPQHKWPVQDRLREAEEKVGVLEKQLAASTGFSVQTYELRCQLQTIMERVSQRDQQVQKMSEQQEKEAASHQLLRERLALAQEDLRSAWAHELDFRKQVHSAVEVEVRQSKTGDQSCGSSVHENKTEAPKEKHTTELEISAKELGISSSKHKISNARGRRKAFVESCVTDLFCQQASQQNASSKGRAAPPPPDVAKETARSREIAAMGRLQEEMYALVASEGRVHVGIQVELGNGDADDVDELMTSMIQEVELRKTLEEMRTEKATLEERGAQELEELRKRIREQRAPSAPLTSEASLDAGKGANGVANGSPGLSEPVSEPAEEDMPMCSAVNTSGMLYVQKIAELESLNEATEQDIELLRETEQCLLQDSQEKDDLIAYLMRKVAETDEKASGRPHSPKRGTGTVAPGLFGLAGLFTGWRPGRQETDVSRDELEHEAEEALKDNVRLRNDLRVLAEEFRKTLAAQGALPERA